MTEADTNEPKETSGKEVEMQECQNLSCKKPVKVDGICEACGHDNKMGTVEDIVKTAEEDKQAVVEFDPTAAIPEIASATPFGFEDLVSEDSGVSAEEIEEEFERGDFGTLDVKDFTDFSVKDYIPKEGEFRFVVEQKFLKEATSITRLTAQVAKSTYNTVKLTLFEDRLKLSTYNTTAFSEIVIPLYKNVENLDEKQISFIFDQDVLSKIANAFVDAIIVFDFVASKQLLIIESENTRLELTTYAETDFIDYHAKIQKEPDYIGVVDVEALRQGVKYTSQFVKKDDIQMNLSLIDIREASIIGGNYASIGVFESERVAGVNLKIKYEIIDIFEKILGKLKPGSTHLFETDSFYLFRDSSLYFGFERSSFAFPAVNQFFEMKAADYTLVPRNLFLNSLLKLSVVSVDRDMLVKLGITGQGQECEIELSTRDVSGKQSNDKISAFRAAANGEVDFKTIECFINLSFLIKISSFFESQNIRLQFIGGKAMLIEDTDEENKYKASTIMSLLDEKQVEAQREVRKKTEEKAKPKDSDIDDTKLEHDHM